MTSKLLVATRKGLFIYHRVPSGAAGWSLAHTAFVGDRVALAIADPRDGAIYAALDHGHFGAKLQRSDDGGRTFAEIAVPAYPPPPAEPELGPDGKPVAYKLAGIWALAAGAVSQPGRLWCGTAPGGLFVSDDRGASWRLVESLWNHPSRREWMGGGTDLPALHSICVDPRDPRRVVTGVSCGGVWETRDDGETWTCRADGMRAAYMPPERAGDPVIQDPHAVVQAPSAPDVFWVQHHNGIFRSTDDCKSWHEITGAQPSTFGFAVAVHPRNPDAAWFIPAESDQRRIPVDGQVVVTRTQDGGKTFSVLRDGLPQHAAFDLVYRHALDIALTGASGGAGEAVQLAFGSTTGSLWVSHDGERFTALSQHLPPIAAVRFA